MTALIAKMRGMQVEILMANDLWKNNPLQNNERRTIQELESWAMVDEHHPEKEKLMAMVQAKKEKEKQCLLKKKAN